MNAALLSQYTALHARKAALADDLAATNKDISALEAVLLEQFAEDGIQSIKTQDGPTVYLQVQLWARPIGGRENAMEALRLAGLGDLVEETVNLQTLSAWCRERLKSEEELPASFAGQIATAETTHVKVMG